MISKTVCDVFLKNVRRPFITPICKRLSTKQSEHGRGLSYLHAVGKEPLQYTTIGKMIEKTANKWPDNIAIVSRQENLSITYSELLRKADELASAFRELGLERGDRLGLWAPNCLMWNVIKVAACRAGIILVAINPMYQVNEIKYCLNKVGVKALIAPKSHGRQRYYDMIHELAPELDRCKPGNLQSQALPTLKSLIMLSDEELPGAFSYKSLLSLTNSTLVQKIASEQDLVEPDDGCNIQFTSGTTGEPKAALVSHMNMVNNSFYIGKRTHLTSKSKICVQVPLFHAFGIVISSFASFQYGATLVLPALSYSSKDNLDAIISEGCTIVHGTPTMYVDLVSEVANSPDKTPKSLDQALTAGAPCSPHLVKTMQKTLNCKHVTMLYGMSELTACAFIGIMGENKELTYQTVGKIQEHLEAKVVDADERLVPFGQLGELCVRGYSVMQGYWGDEKRTKETIRRSGWLRTGDQFVLYENGYGKIVGRIKDMIIRGGENIYPKEIEDYLNTHSNILESHVFGIPHERLGEEVCVAIKIKPHASLTADDVRQFCQGRMGYFKIPKHVRIVSSFPKTLSGKIQKHRLREMLISGQI